MIPYCKSKEISVENVKISVAKVYPVWFMFIDYFGEIPKKVTF